MQYIVDFDTTGHYLHVELNYSQHDADRSELVLNMPRWAPGYYQILDFAKHLCDFSATDSEEMPVAWRKDGMNRWRITIPKDQRQSLDDVMRLLYNRYYRELKRGFTEEEFWQAVAEAAGDPLPEMRRLVDTACDIDYNKLLEPAGLYVDTTTWSILRVANPTKQQKSFLDAMGLK